MLAKAGSFRKVMAVTQAGIPNARRKAMVAVATLVLKTMARRTSKSSSHHRSVLGGKGNAISPRSIQRYQHQGSTRQFILQDESSIYGC